MTKITPDLIWLLKSSVSSTTGLFKPCCISFKLSAQPGPRGGLYLMCYKKRGASIRLIAESPGLIVLLLGFDHARRGSGISTWLAYR